jgi:hypothetical protein
MEFYGILKTIIVHRITGGGINDELAQFEIDEFISVNIIIVFAQVELTRSTLV